MKELLYLIKRNCKIYFKDKGLFFSSLIAPLILLFLFVAFLGGVYKDSLLSVISDSVVLDDKLINGFCGGWLISSLLAVSSVCIAFTSNLVMVQDKILGRISDLKMTPVRSAYLALGYYISTTLVTLAICYVALLAGLIYLAAVGWYLSVSDVFLTILDTFLMVLFGTALSSIVCAFLRSSGAITAVEAIVSSSYGFLCGAYMPISSLAKGIANTVSLLPGTYGTSLFHEHLMGGAIDNMGLPAEYAERLRSGFDCQIKCFGNVVPEWACFLIIICTVAVLVGAYVLMCVLRKRKKK